MNAADDFEHSNIRYVPLNTSGAFHSRLMRGSMEKFEKYLQNFQFSALKIPVIANTTARPYQDETLFSCLAQQIASPVRWAESIQYLMSLGTVEFTELGHSEVVRSLVEKIKAETTEAELQAIRLQRDADGANAAESTDGSMHNRTLAAAQKVAQWNSRFQIGQKVRSSILNTEVETGQKLFCCFSTVRRSI